MFDAIAEYLGMEYELYQSPDNQFGRRDKDDNWSGMMGELTNRHCRPVERDIIQLVWLWFESVPFK